MADHSPKSKRWRLQIRLSTILILMIVLAVILAIVRIPIVNTMREQAWENHLRQLGLAMLHYEDKYKSLPPAYTCDSSGRRMHSWRALLLEFLPGETAAELRREYDFVQPWDSPHNLRVSKKMPALYGCPYPRDWNSTITKFMVIVGPETPFEGERPITLGEIYDGTSNVIMIVEVANSRTHWTDPNDLSFDRVSEKISTVDNGQAITGHRAGGAYVIMCDSYSVFVKESVDEMVLRNAMQKDKSDLANFVPPDWWYEEYPEWAARQGH